MRGVLEIQEVARRPRLTQSQWNCGQCLKCVEAIDRRDDCNDEREKMQQVWSEMCKMWQFCLQDLCEISTENFLDCFRDE